MCIRTRYGSKGFTLVELMLVVGIITLLIAVVGQPMAKSREEAKLQACVGNLKAMGVAYQSYLADNPNVKNGNPGSMWTSLVPRYLGKIPTCPSSGCSTLQNIGGGAMAGYVWVNYVYIDSEPYPYVMCLGGHNDLLPASRGPWLGPVWSPRTGADDCRTGHPNY